MESSDWHGAYTSTGLGAARSRSSNAEPDRVHREAVARVVMALRQNTDVPLNLSEMAKIAFVSRFHFNRLFRRFTGMPPRQFQSALRIADAMRLLLTSDMTALEVCLSVGYSSLGTFTRRFVEVVGVSPIRLRRLASARPVLSVDHQPRAPQHSGSVAGTLHVPEGSCGVAVVGLYRTALPKGSPIASVVVTAGASEFALNGLGHGDYYALAALIPKPADPIALLLAEASAVGRERVRVDEGRVSRIRISLRPLEITDPPILPALAPVVLKQFLALTPATPRRAAEGITALR